MVGRWYAIYKSDTYINISYINDLHIYIYVIYISIYIYLYICTLFVWNGNFWRAMLSKTKLTHCNIAVQCFVPSIRRKTPRWWSLSAPLLWPSTLRWRKLQPLGLFPRTQVGPGKKNVTTFQGITLQFALVSMEFSRNFLWIILKWSFVKEVPSLKPT